MADVSLNAGLDDDDLIDLENDTPHLQNDAIVSTIDIGDIPEVDYETKRIAEDSRALEDLLHVCEDIAKANGMSQKFALEAMGVMKNFDGGRSVGYYSKDVTATRYKTSMESLGGAVWALLQAGINYAIALVRKILNWVSALVNGSNLTGKKLAASVEKRTGDDLRIVKATSDELGKVIAQAGKLDKACEGVDIRSVSGFTSQPESFDQLVEMVLGDQPNKDAANAFLMGNDPFFYDFVTNGPYVSIIKENASAVQLIVDVLGLKIEGTAKLVEALEQNPTESTIYQAQLTITKLITPLSIGTGQKLDTVQRLAEKIEKVRIEVAGTTPSKKLSLTEAIKAVQDMYDNGPLHDVIESKREIAMKLSEMEETLLKLRDAADSLTPVNNPVSEESQRQLADMLRACIEMLQSDTLAAARLMAQFHHYQMTTTNLARRVLRLTENTAKTIRNAVKGSQNAKFLQEAEILAKAAGSAPLAQLMKELMEKRFDGSDF